MSVFPDFGDLGRIGNRKSVIGSLVTVLLMIMTIASAIVGTIASSNSKFSTALKGWIGIWAGLGMAALTGAGVIWINWLIPLYDQLFERRSPNGPLDVPPPSPIHWAARL